VQTLTDNRVRTVAEIRNMLTKHGGNMGAAGSVGYIFTKRGLIAIERKGIDEDQVMEAALEAGAEDVREAGDLLEVLTAPESVDDVREALAKASIATASAEITMLPSSTVNVSGQSAQTLLKLLELLEDHDDVQSVSSNMDIAAEELEQLSA
jgi:YebC/PmpR family DNA-binding regulatory protein